MRGKAKEMTNPMAVPPSKILQRPTESDQLAKISNPNPIPSRGADIARFADNELI